MQVVSVQPFQLSSHCYWKHRWLSFLIWFLNSPTFSVGDRAAAVPSSSSVRPLECAFACEQEEIWSGRCYFQTSAGILCIIAAIRAEPTIQAHTMIPPPTTGWWSKPREVDTVTEWGRHQAYCTALLVVLSESEILPDPFSGFRIFFSVAVVICKSFQILLWGGFLFSINSYIFVLFCCRTSSCEPFFSSRTKDEREKEAFQTISSIRYYG